MIEIEGLLVKTHWSTEIILLWLKTMEFYEEILDHD